MLEVIFEKFKGVARAHETVLKALQRVAAVVRISCATQMNYDFLILLLKVVLQCVISFHFEYFAQIYRLILLFRKMNRNPRCNILMRLMEKEQKVKIWMRQVNFGFGDNLVLK